MGRGRTKWIASLLAVASALALSACGGASSLGPDTEVALTVGKAKVTNGQVERRARFLATAPDQSGAADPPAKDSDEYWEFRRTAAGQLRDELVFAALARSCGTPCAVRTSEIDAQVAAIQQEQFNGSKADFEKVLAERGITMADLRAILRTGLQEQRLVERQQRRGTFTDAQARAYYEKNIALYRVPAERRLSHILLGTRAVAVELRAGLTADGFAETARERSLDPAAKTTGGDLGTPTSSGLIPEIRAAAAKLAPGVISQPIETQFGWHLLLVTDVKARTKPFDEVKDAILAEQLQVAQLAAVERWRNSAVKKLQDSAKFTNDRIAPKAPATTTTTGAATTTATTTTSATTTTAP